MAEQDKPDNDVIREEGPIPPEVPFYCYESLMAELARRVWECGPDEGETIH